MTKLNFFKIFIFVFSFFSLGANAQILQPGIFKHYIDTFNLTYTERKINAIDNAHCWSWMEENIPFFECPDKELERSYYFRWYTYRKHIKQTPDGYVITEFLPDVSWAGKYNNISAAAPHHFYEGRWLRNKQYLNDYAIFWFKHGGSVRSYSSWLTDAIYNYYLVAGNKQLLTTLLPDLIANYEKWEETNKDSSGLFWQLDVRDGMEESIGGNGYRPTINSYMYGDAMAIAKVAAIAGESNTEKKYLHKAATLKAKVQQMLWDKNDQFFKVLPKEQESSLVCVRELLGYIPWYFNLPDNNYSSAWKYLRDTNYFEAPYGPATAEKNHSRFMYENRRVCMWNGYSWPFATSQTLQALINLLNNYGQNYVTKKDFFELLMTYNRSQRITLAGGGAVPWIDESLQPFTGEWFTRNELFERNDRDKERGEFYNHSTFNDLVISGLIGIHPGQANKLTLNPLLPEGQWNYFCLDQLEIMGSTLTILYDKTGEKYKLGKGFMIIRDGKKIASSPVLKKLIVILP